MATTQRNLNGSWDSNARYTAGSDLDVLITNPNNSVVYWWITTDDTAPTIQYTTGNPIGPYGSQGLTLATGERVWLAGDDYATVNVQE